MNKQLLCRITMISLILLVGAFSGQAQSRRDEMVVEVPFDFNIGDRTLSSGNYTITRSLEIQNLLIFRRADRSVAAIVHTSPLITPPEQMKTCLNFNEYRGQRFLTRVQSRDGTFSDELMQKRRDR
jgi:hypothetical protein